ncbi:hypothetical protein DPMN_073320 [Dreissena polymorpha]|uniref:Uncharacterized protein n=2 Tax=Dreissena polymorpha TaxID=45954 RepID=A0A9D4BYW7_DREPO|nr:hypothetical protein DPMN_073320 [Dreissena polymorpha]
MTLKNSVIKGYHVFMIRPFITSPPTQLIVDRDYSNKKDPDACLVWLPALETFPISVHDTVTDEKRQLKLSDIAGLPIGHVPKILSNFFSLIINEGGTITAQVTGEPVPSFPPWPAPNEEGRGVVLPCNYVINHSDIKATFSKLCLFLEKSPEGSAMDLSIETTPKA